MLRRSKAPHATRTLVCLACTALAAGLYLSGFAPWLLFELGAKDLLVRYGRKVPRHPEIVYLVIDQASVSLDGVWPDEVAASPALQRIQASGWPWSRDVYPLIFDRLFAAGAKVVALDLLFPTAREGDEAFRVALEKYGSQVVIGSNFVDADRERSQSSSIHALPAATLIFPEAAVDPRTGFVNFWPDVDGVVRRAFFRRTKEEIFGLSPSPESERLLSFSARILEKIGRSDLIPPGTAPKVFRFAGSPEGGFIPRSVYEIFVPSMWEKPPYHGGSYFQDKIVLIGPEGNWSKDYVKTPLGDMPGPEVHLNALNAALHRDFIAETPRWMNVLLILLGGAVTWALSTFVDRLVLRSFLLVGAGVAYFGIALFTYNGFIGHSGMLVILASPLAAAASSAVVWLVWEQIIQRLEKVRTRKMLERYVSRNVVKEILDNPSTFLDTLGGVRKPVAVMFTDLRGFTTLTEQADSQQLVTQLNEYFSRMVEQVFANQGTLDKFIGDAIMAVWGNVQSEGPARDVERAVTAALEMRRCLEELNAEWHARGSVPLAMGIGINFGEAIVGNIGSPEKMELTVIGDPVNLASRLEGLTKEYGLDLVLGEEAGELARESFHVQFVDRVRVKGKTKAVKVFTVLGPLSRPLDAQTAAYLALHNEGVEKYQRQDFAAARSCFEKCLSIRPHDTLASLYAPRCRELENQAPDTSWDGVFVMKTK